MSSNEISQIRERIYNYFNIGRTKEIEQIQDFLFDCPAYSRFSDYPPYERLDIDRSITIQQLFFATISDFEFEISEMKIDVLGDMAISTFILKSKGIIVDDYSFRGTTVKNISRATFVMKKDTGSKWRIIHEHMSKIPVN